MTELLTVAAAAARVRVSVRTVSEWISEGLPVIPDGNRRLIRLDHLQARARRYYQERHRPKPRLPRHGEDT